MKKLTFVFSAFLSSGVLFAQNTMSYTSLEQHYNKGIELFEKKSYVAARKEFQEYISLSKNILNPNGFTIANAEYFSVVAGLQTNSPDADIDVERFVINNGDHPKAKLIYSDLANKFYERGDYANAITYFNKAITFRQNSLELYADRYKLGTSYYLVNDLTNALVEFDFVKNSISEEAIPASYYAAVINFKNEKFDAALADLTKVENVSPYKTEAPNWIAQIYFRQKRYNELIAYAEPIIANPNGRKIDEVCLVTAEVFYFRDEFQKSALYYDKFRQFRRNAVDKQVTFRHGFSLFKVENYKEAVTIFKQIASERSELGQQSAYYLGISALKSGDLNAATAAFNFAKEFDFDAAIKEEATYNLTKVLVEQGKNDEAIRKLKDYVTQYPNGKYTDQSNELLSDILFETNDYKSAIEYIESLSRKTASIQASYQKLTYNQGVLEFNNEKFQNSIAFFNKSLTTPNDSKLTNEAKFWKAEAFYALEKPESEALYRELLNTGGDYRVKSLYSLGYLFFNKKDYASALKYFQEFTTSTKSDATFKQNKEDATLRLADCYLATKSYSKALSIYNEAINSNQTDRDYAMYQKGVTLLFMDKTDEANQVFKAFATNYPNSRFIDNSLFEQGKIEVESGKYQNAVTTFTELLRRRSNSVFVPQALLKRALAFYNLKNYEKAISDYKVLVQKFGKTKEAEEALLGLRDLLNMVNRSEEFTQLVEEYKQNNPESSSVVSLQFDAAKNLYFTEKHQQAISALKNYLAAYPTSSNAIEAKFYIADSYYILKDNANAKKYFEEVVADNQSRFLAQSAYRAGQISFADKQFKDAVRYYGIVKESSSNKREIVLATEGIYKSYFSMQDFGMAIKFAEEVVSNGGDVVIGASNRAQLVIGKSYQATKQYSNAVLAFQKTISMAKDANAAEAKFRIGEMENQQSKYAESTKTLQELSQNFSEFVEWYEEGFLLIAQNYLALNDTFMAKATLTSIIENSETPETVQRAKVQLAKIK